jgi:hypothetical protein
MEFLFVQSLPSPVTFFALGQNIFHGTLFSTPLSHD